jgi:His-Xaa-Ser system protein HxsD
VSKEKANDTDDNLEELTFALDERRVSFTVDEELYPRDAVYGAAYLFIDRCWVYLGRPEAHLIEVRLKHRSAEVTEEQLVEMAGEFANELLNQVVRLRVGQSTAQIREYYFARAFITDDTQSSIDSLLAELDAEVLEEDSLEISVPWEEAGG